MDKVVRLTGIMASVAATGLAVHSTLPIWFAIAPAMIAFMLIIGDDE